jgi:hypothetical protein
MSRPKSAASVERKRKSKGKEAISLFCGVSLETEKLHTILEPSRTTV